MKRLLYVLGIVVVIVVVVLVGYFLRPKDVNNPIQNPTASGGVILPPKIAPPVSLGGLPTAITSSTGSGAGAANTSQTFGVVAQNPTLDYVVTGKNEVILIERTGRVVRISNGKEEVLSSATIDFLARGGVSPDGKYVFAVAGEPEQKTRLFDVDAKTWTTLAPDVREPTWAPTGHTLAFLSRAEDAGPTVLATFDAAGSPNNARPIVKLHIQDATLMWPAQQTLLVAERSSAYVPGSAFLINTQTGGVTIVASDQIGLDVRWSPEGTDGLLFHANDNRRGGVLLLMTANGAVEQVFRLTTIPEKCSFGAFNASDTANSSSRYVACGFPAGTDIFQGSYMPDDYLKGSLYMPDYLYRIDLKTGDVDNLLLEAGITEDSKYLVDVTDPKVFNNTFFFVNRFDDRLYGLAMLAPAPIKTEE